MRQSYHEGLSFKQTRSVKVMLDFDLAEIYGYTTSRFNEQVSNNANKFEGDDFSFILTDKEFTNLISKKSISSWGGRRKKPRAFTEQGIYMLITALKGNLAGRAGFGGRAEPSNLGCRGGVTEKSQIFFSEIEIFPALFSYIRAKGNTGIIRSAL